MSDRGRVNHEQVLIYNRLEHNSNAHNGFLSLMSLQTKFITQKLVASCPRMQTQVGALP